MRATILFLYGTVLFAASAGSDYEEEYMKFPANFKLGVSSSSYQVEGAWNVSDKGVSVWDDFTHNQPELIYDGSNGDTTCNTYNKYKEDLILLKNLGVNFYRFSLSWTRILPTGFGNKISRDGIQYYKNLLDDLKSLGIEPFVTIYHWDHPLVLEQMGGWTNEMMITWFADYARIVFDELGSRIKNFATINEPSIMCTEGYGNGIKAPGKKLPLLAPYLCMHNMLKAHAKVYKMYDSEYRKKYDGQIGIVMHCDNRYSKSENDTESGEILVEFECGWGMNPIFSEKGDYPEVMKQRIAENSRLEGYPRSRLPQFTRSEIDYIRGSSDYLGINHYTSTLTEPAPKSDNTIWYQDTGVVSSHNMSCPPTASQWLRIFPQGLGDILRRVKNLYNNPPIYILENGMADDGSSLKDYKRIEYLRGYIREMLLAINRDGCNVRGYSAWSFLDNFEWQQGYHEHFGLISVDFKQSSKPRTPKLSYEWFQELIRDRKLPPLTDLPKIETTVSLESRHYG